jgi:organic hydroperoxide reductase OsmC/OhrA
VSDQHQSKQHQSKQHQYQVEVKWTGNTGTGTSSYRAYQRSHEISASGKSTILGSADPAFRGDPTRYNPEEFLVASLSTCHMLWYLHLCADAKIVVTDYVDAPIGTMMETENGSGRFAEVVLNPTATITAESNRELANALHEKAHHFCFIANSVNFPIQCRATVQVQSS